MLYLRNTTDLQYVVVPLERWNGIALWEADDRKGNFAFKAKFDNKDIEIEEGPGEEESPSEFGHYARLAFRLPEGVADGSYELTLAVTAPAELAGSQSYVVQVGDYVAASTEYEKTIEYEQFR